MGLAPVLVQLADLLVRKEHVVERVVGHLPYERQTVLAKLLAPVALDIAHLLKYVTLGV